MKIVQRAKALAPWLFIWLLPVVMSGGALDDLRSAVNRNDMRSVSSLARKYAETYRPDLGTDLQRSIRQDAIQRLKNPNPVPPLLVTLSELEIATKQKNGEVAYRKAIDLEFSAIRLQMANRPDPAVELQAAQQAVASDASYMSLFRLTIASLGAGRYEDAVSAGQRALQLKQTDLAATHSADSVHTLRQMIANAHFELSRYELAEQVMLESLDNDNLPWLRPYPDFNAARKLLEAGRREGVIRYLEKAASKPFRKTRVLMQGWISELRAGGTPNLIPPDQSQ